MILIPFTIAVIKLLFDEQVNLFKYSKGKIKQSAKKFGI